MIGKLKLPNIISPFIILFIGLLIYSNSFEAGWHFDDSGFITQNPSIRDIHNVEAIWKSLTHPIRFVSFYSFALNYHFGQYDVFGYHVVNFSIHIITAICVWWFMLLLLRTPAVERQSFLKHKNAIALTAALLFLTHPIQTQAITYITQRFASLATMFYMLSLCFYGAARLSRRTIGVRGMLYGMAGAAAVLGMFTKEIVFTLPLTVLLFELFFMYQNNIKAMVSNKKFWITALVLLVLLLLIPILYKFSVVSMILNKEEVQSGSHIGDSITTYSYFLTQFRVVVTYVRLMFIPLGQNLLYDFPLSYSFFEWKVVLSALFLISLITLGFLLRKKYVFISFGILWFFLTLSVESSIIPIQHVIFEHRLYLPSVGFCVMLTMILYRVVQSPQLVRSIVVVLVAVLSVLTYQRNKVWQDTITLWTDNTKKSPQLARPFMNLGNGYFKIEDYENALEVYLQALERNPHSSMTLNNIGNVYFKLNNYDQAIVYYDKALKINPYRAVLYSNKADVYRNMKKYELALENYTKAIELDIQSEQTLTNRGLVYNALKQYDLALLDYNEAIRLSPHYDNAYNNRGNLYRKQGQLDKALADYTQALTINPLKVEAYSNRGLVLKRLNKFDEALADYSQALKLNPQHDSALNNKATTLMTMHKYDEAIEAFSEALKVNPNLFEAYYNRGLAYIKVKKYRLALDDYNQVLKLNQQYTNAYYQKANIYSMMNELDKALDNYNQALQLNNRYGLVYFKRSQVHLAQQNFDQALKDALKAKELGHQVSSGYIAHIKNFESQ